MQVKSDTYVRMDKMIEKIAKYRKEFRGERVARFLKESPSARS